jgi:hypothetical protein
VGPSESRRVPPSYQVSDDRQKIFHLLPIPRPKIRAMKPTEAQAADMGPHKTDGDVPWSDLPCLWCDKTPTHPYQVDIFELCHCDWRCASKTLLWLRSIEDERILRESLGLPDDVDLGLEPEPEPAYEPGGGLVGKGGRLTVASTANLKPGDVLTLKNGERVTVIQDEGNGQVTVRRDEARNLSGRAQYMNGVRPSQVIMDEMGLDQPVEKVYEAGSDRPMNVVVEGNLNVARAAVDRQIQAAKRIRQERRSRW